MQLNKQEKGEKEMNTEWVKSSYELMDGIRMGIDQVSVSIPYTPPSLGGVEQTQMYIAEVKVAQHQHKMATLETINYVRKAVKQLFKSKPAKAIKGSATLQRFNVICEADGSYVATVTLGLLFGTPVLNYTFNPHKLTSEGRCELEALLTMTHPLGYGGVYMQGVIARIEFFLDIANVHPNDLVLLDTGKRKTTRYMTTTYHGRRGRPLVGTTYDKAQQLKIDGQLTRIEIRIKRQDVTLQQLVEIGITNPFAPFIVVPNSALDSVASKWKLFPELADHIRLHGLHGGIKNTSARKAITKQLRELSVPWWDVETIWPRFKEIMQEFRPSFIGGEYLPDQKMSGMKPTKLLPPNYQ